MTCTTVSRLHELPDGGVRGCHVFARLHAYLDTRKVAEVCDRLVARGMAKAAAPPIEL